METIRNYLETMFLNLPNTPEVYRAKNELWQMMEDKYAELKAEGKSENEAVGIVISEFGNLDELAKDLGIEQVIHENPIPKGRPLPLEDVKCFLADKSKHAFMTALGVLLCILSPCGPMLFYVFGEHIAHNSPLFGALGACSFFIIIAVAVGIFIYSGIMISRWGYLKREPYVTDFATTEYLHQAMESFKPTYALMLTVGVILCVISLIPVIILDEVLPLGPWSDFSTALMFALVAIGVFLIVMASMKLGSYKFLLHMNRQGTVGGSYVPSQDSPKYRDRNVGMIMSVYWPTVTCLYLIWSFLTFDWWITWIIWPIARIISALVNNLMSE